MYESIDATRYKEQETEVGGKEKSGGQEMKSLTNNLRSSLTQIW